MSTRIPCHIQLSTNVALIPLLSPQGENRYPDPPSLIHANAHQICTKMQTNKSFYYSNPIARLRGGSSKSNEVLHNLFDAPQRPQYLIFP